MIASAVDAVDPRALRDEIASLAAHASIEIIANDVVRIGECRKYLAPGTEVFVSHLPKQRWDETARVAIAIREAGFEPVPHLPVRALASVEELGRTLRTWVSQAGVNTVLLIAGDRAEALGPFTDTLQVIRSGVLQEAGVTSVVIAGHPGGHPVVASAVLRRFEAEKVEAALAAGIDVTFLTQFFFDSDPFLRWIRAARERGLRAPVIAGLAGPAKAATLMRYAAICGVGASLRALQVRGGQLLKIWSEHGPEDLVVQLALARRIGESDVQGIHLFPFGGLLRTARWLDALAQSAFTLQGGTLTVHVAPP